MNLFTYTDKVIVITGSGSGIGQAMAIQFAGQGGTVAIVELTEDGGQDTLNAITEAGGNANVYGCDVADTDAVQKTMDQIEEDLGPIDVLINNAGIAHIGNVVSTQPEDMDRIYNVNIKGVYNCLHSVVEKMQTRQKGVVLNLASLASKVAVADRFAYSMSKGAVLTMTYSVAIDYVKDGIRCNCICPARVHTPFVDGYLKNNYPDNADEMFEKLSAYQPIGRMGKPEEIANLAIYLCSDEAAFVTGSAYDIDGGVTHLIP